MTLISLVTSQGTSVGDALEGLYRWLHQTIRSFDTTRESLDEFGTKTAEGLMSPHDMALRLSLQAAQAADLLPASIALADESARADTGQEEMVYEFVSEVSWKFGHRTTCAYRLPYG